MINLIDRDGDSVKMSVEDIAQSLAVMGNPAGEYKFVHDTMDKSTENIVLQFRAYNIPKYSWFAMLKKRIRWHFKELAYVRAVRAVDTIGLVVKPRPFVLEKPWLRLKGNKAVTIYVD